MKKGINQWCFPEGTPLQDVFAWSREAGFDAVELNVYNSGGTGLTLDTNVKEAEEILRQAERHNIELRSLSTGLLWESPLSSGDESVRERGRKVVQKQLELAGAMGMDTILVVPGVVNEETSYSDCYERSQRELVSLASVAERIGVMIGIENVWNKFLLSPLEMKRYVDEIQSDFAGVYFDVGNVLQFGYPEQWIRTLGSRIKKVHVKDFSTAVGNITGFVPLLAGDVNWKEVVKALHDIGYDDVLTAEISPYPFSPQGLAMDTGRQLEAICRSLTPAERK
ncbi:sugar phosphate isomerase/epimerase family protein [Peribacillus sp. SCS-26]|uniref:sugar phosphate isomerase/epimerase family protein n=1 Tax=Paraperibacillus marinus TaxID=3115295 RepID=UPI0039059A13